MAKLIGGFDIKVDFSADYKEYERQVQAGVEQCRESLANNSTTAHHTGDMVGKVVKFQIADGYAEYMVVSEKPVQLIHLGFGDGYQIPDAHMRGLNLSDIREMVKSEEALARMFS